ncbi:MAG: FtsX-like permease family protein, partial [Candidatus Hodarchaeales archaeon]
TLLSSQMNNLGGCLVELHNDSVILTSGLTNDTGYYRFVLSDPGNYSVSTTYNGFSWNGYVVVENQTTHLNIPLGHVRLLIFTHTVSNHPVSGVGVSLSNSSDYLQTFYTNSSGLIEVVLPIGHYSLFFSSRSFSPLSNVNLTTSQIKWINKTIEETGNLTLTFENQFYQNIDDAFVILHNVYHNYEVKLFTDVDGKIVLNNLPWGTFTVSIIHDDFALSNLAIELASQDLELTLVIDTEGPIISTGNIAYWQDRSFSVVWSSEFVSGFLETTLSLITTTLTTLIIVVSVLSLLSITSVISHPIVANKRTILTFQHLGANRQQILFTIVFQLVLLGLIASIIGSILGMWGMTILPQFQHINIGGVIIQPRVDIWLLLAILLSNITVIALKTAQKVNEIYTSHLPGNNF